MTDKRLLFMNDDPDFLRFRGPYRNEPNFPSRCIPSSRSSSRASHLSKRHSSHESKDFRPNVAAVGVFTRWSVAL
jgi:hypothetical protein